MKGTMKSLGFVLITISLGSVIGCSGHVQRTKFTDKNLRIMLDPESVSPEDYVRIQAALVESEKWAVIDRAKAFEAIKREQEALHRNEIDRFDDKQKYAHWGRLHGVGAVVVGHSQCVVKDSFWGKPTKYCNQFLNIVDANTGEVIAAVENENDSHPEETPDWMDVVAKLNDAYPEDYRPQNFHEKIHTYRAESEERAVREKEKMAREPAKAKEE